MKKYLAVGASFIIMTCLGSVYAWSIVAVELIQTAKLTTAHTQFIFGVLIAVFPVTMIFSGKMEKKYGPKLVAYLSAIFFLLGYLIAGFSKGHFLVLVLSMGVLTGMGTGMGYLVSLTVPVQWFPHRKGLMTGIATAGFGIGALIFSFIAEAILNSGYNVFELFLIIGLGYSVIIFLMAGAFSHTQIDDLATPILSADFIKNAMFRKLVLGIFLGTFAGLMLIGSLKLIGSQSRIENHILNIGVSLFAVFNFTGRIFWGYVSDHIGAPISIFFALTIQAIAIALIGFLVLNDPLYLLLSSVAGFGFGGNFVLFAKQTSHVFGIAHLGVVYPYVFLGYAVAGIFGPLSGGLLYDYTGYFLFSGLLASVMSITRGMIFFIYCLKKRTAKPCA